MALAREPRAYRNLGMEIIQSHDKGARFHRVLRGALNNLVKNWAEDGDDPKIKQKIRTTILLLLLLLTCSLLLLRVKEGFLLWWGALAESRA